MTVTVDPEFTVRSPPVVMDGALDDAGYGAKVLVTETSVARFRDEGTSALPALGGTINYGVRGAWGVALTGVHTLKGWSGGYSRATGKAVSADVTTTEGALLVTREMGIGRAGVGPSYRQVDLDWVAGFCQCVNEQAQSSGAAGLAAEGLVTLPLNRRLFPAFRVLARYYPSQETGYEELSEPLDVAGFVLTMGVSLATRF